MQGIDFYLDIFKKISSFYTKRDENQVNISQKISELINELKKTNDKDRVREAITQVLSWFESYYLDEYNITSKKIPPDAHKLLNQTLEEEVLSDEYESLTTYNIKTLSDKQRTEVINLLKDELLK